MVIIAEILKVVKAAEEDDKRKSKFNTVCLSDVNYY